MPHLVAKILIICAWVKNVHFWVKSCIRGVLIEYAPLRAKFLIFRLFWWKKLHLRFGQKCSIPDEDPHFGYLDQNAPSMTKILNFGCLSQKCSIFDENPEFWCLSQNRSISFQWIFFLILLSQHHRRLSSSHPHQVNEYSSVGLRKKKNVVP